MNCPMCSSIYATLLGILGKLAHLRCRHCGWTYAVSADEVDYEDAE
jgi:transposase-like protein